MRSQSRAIVVGVALMGGGCFDDPNPVATVSGGDTCATECGGGSTSAGAATASDPPPTTSTTASTTTGAGSSGSSESSAETGPVAICGDGELNQPSEMCDGGPGCDGNCEFEDYGCNPLNNAGCGPDLRCGLADFAAETFICMVPGAAELGEYCGGGGYPNDGECAVGLTCTFNAITAYDCGLNCCVEYCDLTDSTFVCADGASCYPFFGDAGPMYQGLEHLGGCLFDG